jgi:Pretoxin HINT domain
VLTRPEFDPESPLEVKVVEEVFVRTAFVLNLHVGGRVIRTTAEHPFWVKGKGWRHTWEIQPGDPRSSHDGHWTPVEAVTDSKELTTVYNVRVADCHTYFVGGEEWGFSVWAHNSNACVRLNSNNAKANFGLYQITINWGGTSFLHKIGKADLGRITQSSELPTRLHQQVRKLEKVFGKGNVIGKNVDDLGVVTTLEAKAAETARLQRWFDAMGFVPRGNTGSFIPIIW